jgi:hypothetical protein
MDTNWICDRRLNRNSNSYSCLFACIRGYADCVSLRAK